MFSVEESRHHFELAPRKKDLHLHLEGIFKPDHIFQLWDTLQIEPNDQPREDVKRIMNDPEISLFSFINKLSTRWLSYTVRKATLLYDASQRVDATDDEKKYANLTPEYVYKTIFKSALDIMHAQGLDGIELQAALLNLTREGDMSTLPVIHGTIPAHESKLFQEWGEKLDEWKQQDKLDQYLVGAKQYIQYFTEVVDSDDRFCSARKARTSPEQMDVRLKFQLRREKPTDQKILMNKTFIGSDGKEHEGLSFEGLAFMQLLRSEYQAKRLDGLEIAGVEDDLSVPLLKYTGYLRFAQKYGMPLTVHAGEGKPLKTPTKEEFAAMGLKEYFTFISAYEKAKQIYENLIVAINYGAMRIGHGVRLFDPIMQPYLEEAIERGIVIDLSQRSHRFTGVAVDDHPTIRALAGDHPLFNQNPDLARGRYLYERFCRQLIITTDDPVIIPDNQALVYEQDNVFNRLPVGQFKPEVLAHQFNDNSERAFLPVLQLDPHNNARAPYSPGHGYVEKRKAA